MELGDLVEKALKIVGVDQAMVSEWITLPLTGKPCYCDERKVKLNALSRWAKWYLKRWARRIIWGRKPGDEEEARKYLEAIMQEEEQANEVQGHSRVQSHETGFPQGDESLLSGAGSSHGPTA